MESPGTAELDRFSSNVKTRIIGLTLPYQESWISGLSIMWNFSEVLLTILLYFFTVKISEDRIFSVNDRILFVNDRLRSVNDYISPWTYSVSHDRIHRVGIIYLKSRSYTFSYDRIVSVKIVYRTWSSTLLNPWYWWNIPFKMPRKMVLV